MIEFQHMTARVAVWNIAGFLNITDERAKNQIEGLAILDAEFVTLVEVKPFSHMQRLIDFDQGDGQQGTPGACKIPQ